MSFYKDLTCGVVNQILIFGYIDFSMKYHKGIDLFRFELPLVGLQGHKIFFFSYGIHSM